MRRRNTSSHTQQFTHSPCSTRLSPLWERWVALVVFDCSSGLPLIGFSFGGVSRVKLRECGIFYGVQSGQPGKWHLPLKVWRAEGTTADEFEISDDRHWPSHRYPRPHLAALTA